ncbi:MAG: ATP-binding protein, partial [Planctomycetes bacterium]|nr:ATP-binding protein [Planctomycetota bacterium]
IVAGLLAHGIHESDETVLLVDVGTNGEMALRSGGKTYACATAAGPAFEGAQISSGMRAATGAISSVDIGDDDIIITTVDNAAARGLCGTGLLDAVAILLNLGIVDETGMMFAPDEIEDECPELPEKIRARVVEDDNGSAFVLAFAEDGHPRITLTQRDVREFQLAKGAMAAGVMVLLDHLGIKPENIDRVCLAGGFGSYLRPENALRVGLLPLGIGLEKIEAVGNAALAGSRLCLLDSGMRAKAELIADEVKYFELSGRPEFQIAFADGMEFPEE